MLQEPAPVVELMGRLQGFATAVAAIMATTMEQASVDWQWRPAPDEWSLTELFCHLRDVEREVHQVRFHSLLASENAFISGAVADEWVAVRQYARQDGRLALQDFLAARDKTVALLATMPPTYWQRQGRHAFFGPTTAHELLNLAVNHDQAHWEQLQTLLKP
jgi:hypothetical protein